MKILISVSLFTLMLIRASTVQATTGSLSFTGEMSVTTCKAALNGGGASGTVTLPTISVDELDTREKEAGHTLFDIQLSGCAGTLKTASVWFETVADGAGVQGAVINNSGTAGNVGVVIYDATNNNFIQLDSPTVQQARNTWYSITSGSATLRYSVRYCAFGATTPGTVLAKASYTLMYK